jgi:hypothetical protein
MQPDLITKFEGQRRNQERALGTGLGLRYWSAITAL